MKKKVLSVVLAASMAAALAGCGGAPEETKAPETTAAKTETTAVAEGAESEAAEGEAAALGNFEGQELSVSTFSFNAELLQKNVYDPFMEATGCKLIVEGGKNAERVTKIKETPENYDVVIIGDAFVADLIDADLLEKADYSTLTNRDALYDNAKAPFGEEYGPCLLYTSSTEAPGCEKEKNCIYFKRRQYGCDYHVLGCSAWTHPERSYLYRIRTASG